MKNKLVNVACLVLPSGETLWFKTSEMGEDYLSKVIDSWKNQHPEFEDTWRSMGCVEIRMPIEKYNEIQATNSFNWPEK